MKLRCETHGVDRERATSRIAFHTERERDMCSEPYESDEVEQKNNKRNAHNVPKKRRK